MLRNARPPLGPGDRPWQSIAQTEPSTRSLLNGREARARPCAPQPPHAALHLCSGDLPNRSALAWDPTARTLLPLHMEFQFPLLPRCHCTRLSSPCPCRDTTGARRTWDTHARLPGVGLEREPGPQEHPLPASHAAAPSAPRPRRCPQATECRSAKPPCERSHDLATAEFSQAQTPQSAGTRSGARAQPRTAAGTGHGCPSPQPPWAQGGSRQASTAPALTYPVLAVDRCPGGRARHRHGGPWGTCCRRCCALAFGSGS